MSFHDEVAVGDIHIIHQFEFADEAARTGASGLIPSDIGKVARQLDNDSFFILTDDSPVTWLPMAQGTPATTVTDETLLNQATAVGTSVNFAREDHTHGSPTSATIAAAADYAGRFELASIGTGDITLNMWGWWFDTGTAQLYIVRNRAGVLYAVEVTTL